MKTYKSSLSQFKLKKEKTEFKKVKLTTAKESCDYIRHFYSDDIEIYESFFILLLNRSCNTIGYAKISQGGIAGTVVDPVIIAKYAIDSLCSSVVLAHNHPSGNLKPSEQDIRITQKIKEGLKLFDILVLDHVILSKNDFYSFTENGIL